MNEKQPIRVLIVDDHEMVRRGLGMFIRGYDDLELVGEAANGEEAVELTREVQPDVILMDIIMPGISGIEAAQIIKSQYPSVQIITLTSASDMTSVTAALQAGATSYLLKNVSDDQLANAIRSVVHGQRVMSPEATQALINAATRPAAPAFNLTDREVEVLALMVDGLNNPDIAKRLYLSRSTVKYHISSIFTKLKVSSRSEAVSLALKSGLISL